VTLSRLRKLASVQASEDTVICTFAITGDEPVVLEASQFATLQNFRERVYVKRLEPQTSEP
jgi:hypothetical protein